MRVTPMTHVQSTPASTWVITHGYITSPTVSVKVHENGVLTEILPVSITYPNNTTVQIEFSAARTGEARLA